MKRHLLAGLILIVAAIMVRADDVVPKRTDFSRYTAMVENSPFAVATAPVAAPTVAAWSKDLVVANVAHTPEADLVTIMSLSDKNLKEYVSTGEPNDHGYAIASIEWSDNPGGTKVTISKDGQFATIGFNESVMQAQAPPMPQMPNVPPPAAAAVPPGARPGAPASMPTPHVRGIIQRKPQNPQNPQNANPPPNAAPLTAPES